MNLGPKHRVLLYALFFSKFVLLLLGAISKHPEVINKKVVCMEHSLALLSTIQFKIALRFWFIVCLLGFEYSTSNQDHLEKFGVLTQCTDGRIRWKILFRMVELKCLMLTNTVSYCISRIRIHVFTNTVTYCCDLLCRSSTYIDIYHSRELHSV